MKQLVRVEESWLSTCVTSFESYFLVFSGTVYGDDHEEDNEHIDFHGALSSEQSNCDFIKTLGFTFKEPSLAGPLTESSYPIKLCK